MRSFALAILLLAATLTTAATRAPVPAEGAATILPDPGRAEFVPPDAEFPALRWSNGEISLNDQCPVRRVKLNRSMPAIYVNGEPIGFC